MSYPLAHSTERGKIYKDKGGRENVQFTCEMV